MSFAEEVDAALQGMRVVLGSGDPPAPAAPASLSAAPAWPNWTGAASDAAKSASDELTRTRTQVHFDQTAAVSLIKNAAMVTTNARSRMDGVQAGWQQDKAQFASIAETPLGQIQLLHAGQRRLSDARDIIRDAMTEFASTAQKLQTVTSDLPLLNIQESPDGGLGGDPTQRPHDNRPEIQRALSQPLPKDPKELKALWDKLTIDEKDWLYSQNHNIGNSDGIVTDDRDHYNQLNLADQIKTSTAAAARADALRAQHPDWAEGKNIPSPNKPGAIFDDRLAYEFWQRQYDTARDQSKYLPDLQAVNKAVQASPDRKLMLLDTQTGTQARAAIAVGDPDTSTHVSVTTPGLNTTVHGGIESMTEEARGLRQESLRQLQNTPGHQHDSVAAIAWIGYDPPQVPGFDQPGASLSGGWGVSHDAIARAGAHDLANFYDGIQATHQGGPADLTAIGHSYGSLTTGLALQEPGDHGVSQALFYGSPGIEASTPQDLHLQPGHVYTMETPDDPIQWTYDAREIGQGIPIVGSYLNEAFPDFGENPATNPNFTHLATAPSTVPDGRGGTLNLQGAHGHSDYPRFPDDGGLRTTNYNIAAVIAGLGHQAVPQK